MVNPRTLVIAVLGLGEAGSVIARDLLAAGADVRGYDPAVAAGPGITDTGSEAEAARGADLVLSVNSARAAIEAFRAGQAGLRRDALWADEPCRARAPVNRTRIPKRLRPAGRAPPLAAGGNRASGAAAAPR
jgi:prephenate dehydrogenase